jgi:uridine phosphorylase
MKTAVRPIHEPIAPSELVLNADKSVYHLALHPAQVAPTIILVGDPQRVPLISKYFDGAEHRVLNREFCTHTGFYMGRRITAMSTGIGVDNVDIAMNELDALFNIDFGTRMPKPVRTSLRIVRLGTSGALSPNIPVGSFVHSRYALGLDGLLHYYHTAYEQDETELSDAFMAHTQWALQGIKPYAVRCDNVLGKLFEEGFHQGITATACGFYGPQGREVRLATAAPGLNERMSTFQFNGIPMANYEMESSALFGLGAMLGHSCTTVCAVVANRLRNEFLSDHHGPVDTLIATVLKRLCVD